MNRNKTDTFCNRKLNYINFAGICYIKIGLFLICSHFNFEAIYDVLYVRAGEGLSEAELFSKVDLVIELVKLLQKLLLCYRTVQNHTATHTHSSSIYNLWSKNCKNTLNMCPYEIMALGTTSSSTSWLSWLRTAWRFFSLMFILTDCCCSVWISLLMDDRSLWKLLNMPSIR